MLVQGLAKGLLTSWCGATTHGLVDGRVYPGRPGPPQRRMPVFFPAA